MPKSAITQSKRGHYTASFRNENIHVRVPLLSSLDKAQYILKLIKETDGTKDAIIAALKETGYGYKLGWSTDYAN